MSRFVLIHGTTQSPAGWQRLAGALEARGHRVAAADLPTDHPELLAVDYAEIVRDQVGAEADTIVVAHSASGLVLPATARALNAMRQIWLAAWIPDPRMSLIEEVQQHVDAAFSPDWVGKDATADPAVARDFLFHDCDEATLSWALTTLRSFLPWGRLQRTRRQRRRSALHVHRRFRRPHDPTGVAAANGA